MRTKSVPALLFVLSLAGSSIAVADSGFPRSCAGTYLIQEGSGTKSLWTLGADGVFLGTSSAQPSFNFSNQQGVWDNDGDHGAKAVILDFSFDSPGTLINIGRVDIALHTVGDGCANVAGTLSLRFFEAGEDPLHPSTDTGSAIPDTFTGRRLTLSH